MLDHCYYLLPKLSKVSLPEIQAYADNPASPKLGWLKPICALQKAQRAPYKQPALTLQKDKKTFSWRWRSNATEVFIDTRRSLNETETGSCKLIYKCKRGLDLQVYMGS